MFARAILAGCFALSLGLNPVLAGSVYTTRPDDSCALYLTPDRFPVSADGVADDSNALQEAIDLAGTNNAGVLFIPEGQYRIGKTVYVWPGVRLIGYGKHRPVFVLGEKTPGFQDGDGKYMLFFSGGRGQGAGAAPRDGNPGTFYSAASNIDIEIREGNPAAIGIRFHVAQHCFLSHMEFRLGTARAGLEDIGNEIEDLHFRGGQYGIITRRSAPGWPILAIDCSFERQAVAGIRSHEGGLAIIRPRFSNLPAAISIDAGAPDQLWVSDGILENISGPAFFISHENNARTQINFENLFCKDVPTFAKFRESGKTVKRRESTFVVKEFSHGLQLGTMGTTREVKTVARIEPLSSVPARVPSDIAALPPVETWVNVKTLGAAGDGVTDDTRALNEAIANHPALFLPVGLYRISDTLKLRPDTVLVGFHPSSTAIYVTNNTPVFSDPASPKALLEAPAGGSNVLSGLGVYTSTRNPGAVGVKWMAAQNSLMNDVRLHGGHGTRLRGGIGDSRGRDDRDHWNIQHPSLWVTAGGGGVFKDIWTPSPYAKAGMLISDTTSSGRIYAMSVEHHVENEVIVRDASNWRFYALQFEAEREESPRALPLLIESSQNLLFANTFFYRVVSSFVPFPHAIRSKQCRDLRFRNTHIYSNSKVSFDCALFRHETNEEIRDLEFAALDVRDRSEGEKPNRPVGSIIAPDSAVEKLAEGFLNISGIAVDEEGEIYFSDPRGLQVYRWSTKRSKLEPFCKIPQRPEQLGFDRAGNLLIVAYEGNGAMLALDPKNPHSEPLTLDRQPAKARPGMTPLLPVNRWTGPASFRAEAITPKPHHYISPDGTTFIPASDDFVTGALSWGTKLSDVLRAFALAPAKPGTRFYVCNEAELQTWSFKVGQDGTLSDPRLFAQEGGEGVAVDQQGRVYIAAGQIRVFTPRGKPIEVIEVPQRPTGLVFGGADRKILFITARSALYSVQIP